MKNITITEIAKRAEVSLATVSSVLNNGKVIVSPKTAARIHNIVKDLGYRPSKNARQLRKKNNQTIAFQIDSRIAVDETWQPTIVLSLLTYQGACSYAGSKGYGINLLIPHLEKDLAEIENKIISENAIDGVILNGWKNLPEADLVRILDDFKRCRIPYVTMDHKIHSKGAPVVAVDMSVGVRQLCSRLKFFGHENVAYIGTTGILNPHSSEQRLKIILEEFSNSQMTIHNKNVLHALTPVESYLKTIQVIKNTKPRPSCIIYSGDHMAIAGIRTIMENGLNVPGDISVIGIDNAPYVVNSPVPLSTIDQKHFEQGSMLAKLLLDQIENPESPIPSKCLIETSFIERKSLGYARKK